MQRSSRGRECWRLLLLFYHWHLHQLSINRSRCLFLHARAILLFWSWGLLVFGIMVGRALVGCRPQLFDAARCFVEGAPFISCLFFDCHLNIVKLKNLLSVVSFLFISYPIIKILLHFSSFLFFTFLCLCKPFLNLQKSILGVSVSKCSTLMP